MFTAKAGGRLLAFAISCLSVDAAALGQDLNVTSPDGRNVVALSVEGGQPTFSVARDGEALILPSPLGLSLLDGPIGTDMVLVANRRDARSEAYALATGPVRQAVDSHNELTLDLIEAGPRKRRMQVKARAYDDGIAVKVVIPPQAETAAAIVRGDLTEFRFASPWPCHGLNIGRFDSAHEGEYDPVDLRRVRPHSLFDLPLLCETGKTALVVTEAGMTDFSTMYLAGRPDGGLGVKAVLSPSLEDRRIAGHTRIGSPVETPWRLVMLADRAGELLESTLVTDVSPPSRIADPAWVRPGKTMWDWWNGPTLRHLPNAGSNTETAKALIDFAADNGIQYVTVDEGWYAGAGGGGTVRPGADVTRSGPGFDLAAVTEYARAKGVGIWLWVNWRALDAQMEPALAWYAKMGVAGIKVDFMDRGDQEMVRWYEKVLDATARHRLMINLHGAFVPRGLTRTWPHFVTQEGVLGAEYNKWTRRITGDHNVMLAYTRALLGPMDYTPGGFLNVPPSEFQIRNAIPFVQTTRAHGLAMYVVYPGGLQTLADSPDTYSDTPDGLDFIRAVPADWDETRFLGGETGRYIALARRKGKKWYIGVMNGGEPRRVSVSLSPLGKVCRGQLWEDDDQPRHTRQRRVAEEKLILDLKADGGAAAIVDSCS